MTGQSPIPLIHLITGATGAGKTTYALALAARCDGLRFSIDDWMTTLFWMDSPSPIRHDWALERIARCESLIGEQVRQLAALGIPAILDLGFTTANHRRAFADLARQMGLTAQLHWLDVPAEIRWTRVQARNAQRGETFRMTVDRAMFDFMEDLWEPPGADEMERLAGVRISSPLAD
ncbi:AAA family ATPase [Novosphingobium piscinae]|uniref:ATP-binding protein n=1 Tax=Novosphingobium piscinae TaxID=1507448 RepID=A0A7X1KQF7_9SPHN|nr:ATP-binding protein [Novosphingobium piscinae]MBC2669495.1 ATP-binding protein [Novosphingobium piscinae]